jgi:hypothetical protein
MEQQKAYIMSVQEQESSAHKREREKQERLRQEACELQAFIKGQMKKPLPLGQEAHIAERFRLGGQMHAEEARMNKALL